MSKKNKALKDAFTPVAQCPPQGVVLRIFPVGRPEDEQDAICFEDARALKNYLKKHDAPQNMAYGIRDADLRGLKIGTLDFANGYLENVDLSNSEIRLAALAGATLKNVNFSHAKLKQLNMRDGMAEGCNFAAADMPGSNMIRALVRNCDLRYAVMSRGFYRGTEFEGGKLEGADMTATDMSESVISDADARKIKLENVHMESGRFSNVDFEGADMSYAHMNDVQMVACNLKDVTLAGRETVRGMALTGCNNDRDFASRMQGEALFNPRVGARVLWAVRKKRPAPKA